VIKRTSIIIKKFINNIKKYKKVESPSSINEYKRIIEQYFDTNFKARVKWREKYILIPIKYKDVNFDDIIKKIDVGEDYDKIE